MHIDFLMRMLSKIIARYIACNDDHRNRVKCGVCYTGQNIRQPRSKMAEDDRSLMGYTGIAISCRRGNRFMAIGNIFHLFRTAQSIEHTNDRMAAEAKDIFDIPTFEIINHQISNQFLCHFFILLWSQDQY